MSRPSLQLSEERRPLATIDTDTTDYYDDLGGEYAGGALSPSHAALPNAPFSLARAKTTLLMMLRAETFES